MKREAWKVLIPGRSLKKSRRWEPIDFTGLKLTTPFQKLPNAFFSVLLLLLSFKPIHFYSKPEIGFLVGIVVQFIPNRNYFLFFQWENEIKAIRIPEGDPELHYMNNLKPFHAKSHKKVEWNYYRLDGAPCNAAYELTKYCMFCLTSFWLESLIFCQSLSFEK